MLKVYHYSYFILIICLLGLKLSSPAQIQEVWGEANNYSTDKSLECLAEARLNALDSAFGTTFNGIVRQEIAEMGKKALDNFFLIYHAEYNGDYLGDISGSDSIYTIKNNGKSSLGCRIKIRCRKKNRVLTEVITQSRECDNLQTPCEESEFHSGQLLHLHFKSGEPGWLMVFCHDELNNAHQLLPQKNMPQRPGLGIGVWVQANTDYIIGSKKCPACTNDWADGDTNLIEPIELVLSPDQKIEYNRIDVIFSPAGTHDYDSKAARQQRIPSSAYLIKGDEVPPNGYQHLRGQGYTFLDWMNRNDYNQWLVNILSRNKDAQLTYLPITIIP